MGSFYGAVFVRSPDLEQIRRLLLEAVDREGLRFYVDTKVSRRGWVVLYPSHHGQDFRFSAGLASKLACDVVHTVLHDSDLFAYRAYRAGVEVDRYDSSPRALDPTLSVAECLALRGAPERFAEWLVPPSSADTLRARLREGSRAPEVLLADFAKALGLEGARSAFEYIEQDEHIGPPGRRRLVHVPAGLSPREERRKLRAAAEVVRKRFQTEGLLAFSLESPAKNGTWVPHFGCAFGDGFLVNRARGAESTAVRLEPSGWSSPKPTGIGLSNSAYALVASPAGDRVAVIGSASQKSWVELWADGGRIASFSHLAQGSSEACFSRDGRLLLARSGGRYALLDAASGETLGTFTRPADVLTMVLDLDGRSLLAFRPCFVEALALPDGKELWSSKLIRHPPLAGAGALPRSAAFSRSGTRLFVATDVGLVAYEAPTLSADGDELLEPLWAAHPRTGPWAPHEFSEAVDGTALFWVDSSGDLLAVDTATGQVTVLTTGLDAVTKADFVSGTPHPSADGRHLLVLGSTRERRSEFFSTFARIFDLAALRARERGSRGLSGSA